MTPVRAVLRGCALGLTLVLGGCDVGAVQLPGSAWLIVAHGDDALTPPVPLTFDADSDGARLSLPCAEVPLLWLLDADATTLTLTPEIVPPVMGCPPDQLEIFMAVWAVHDVTAESSSRITLSGRDGALRLQRASG